MNVMTTAAVVTGAVVVAASIGTGGTPSASAEPAAAGFGAQLHVTDTDGAGTGGYTVDDLQPSGTNELNVPLTGEVPLAGTLWEAPVAVDAVSGSVIPAMQFFNARTADGQNYRVLEQTLAPDLSVSPLNQGGNSSGSIYFDVTGPAPTEVVYDDGQNRLVWAG
ncbi:DUF1942 domain-containing protein [Mycolicibacterium sp. 624]|uniref:DUF1942 domain-containing protein n=1 Tax=Mycolicibacterium sp. 624 TaxID=3156314 RepID=UPI003393CF58